jgi:hypothetical protein
MVVLPNQVVAMSKPRKGKNFNQEKETQLCRNFLHVLQDPIIGKAQKSQAFWGVCMSTFQQPHASVRSRKTCEEP